MALVGRKVMICCDLRDVSMGLMDGTVGWTYRLLLMGAGGAKGRWGHDSGPRLEYIRGDCRSDCRANCRSTLTVQGHSR